MDCPEYSHSRRGPLEALPSPPSQWEEGTASLTIVLFGSSDERPQAKELQVEALLGGRRKQLVPLIERAVRLPDCNRDAVPIYGKVPGVRMGNAGQVSIASRPVNVAASPRNR